MRIIAGKFRSRIIKTPKSDKTRPTTDKTRESLFNIIGPYFDGGNFLDLFAGSGAVALEAISRGFQQAICIDKNYEAIKVIKTNINDLKVQDDVKVFKGDYRKVLSMLNGSIQFNCVYIDPPYRFQDMQIIMESMIKNDLLSPNALLIVETTKENMLEDRYDDIIKTKEYVYGISKLVFYQKEENQ